MDKNSRIFVAGHRGLVGSAICRELKRLDYRNIITIESTDLTRQTEVDKVFHNTRAEYVFLAAAKVGGIMYNMNYPATFIYDNLMIQSNIIEAAKQFRVKKLLFLGSSCIYPRDCPQPIKEAYFMDGKLEPTNDAYAIAKIAGIKMVQAYRRQHACNFIAAMPTNLYGPNDRYNLIKSHVLPALIRKFHEAKISESKSVILWGTGQAWREFLYVDDCARALVMLMEKYNSGEIINIGYGEDITIKELADKIADTIGYQGLIEFDNKNPDGMPQKLLDSSKINSMGWKPKVGLSEGIELTYKDFLKRGTK
jgi:GDP-L-fucose synthase